MCRAQYAAYAAGNAPRPPDLPSSPLASPTSACDCRPSSQRLNTRHAPPPNAKTLLPESTDKSLNGHTLRVWWCGWCAGSNAGQGAEARAMCGKEPRACRRGAACKREPHIKTCAYVGAGGRGRAREGGVHVCYLLCGFWCVGQDVDAPVGMYLPYANTPTATRGAHQGATPPLVACCLARFDTNTVLVGCCAAVVATNTILLAATTCQLRRASHANI